MPTTDTFSPGQRVRVTQQTPRQLQTWTIKVEGIVQRQEQRKTGSWYAHAKDDKLWLDRLVLKKDDGEIVVVNLDQHTHIDLLDSAAEPPSPNPHDPSDAASDYDTGHGPRLGYATAGSGTEHSPAGRVTGRDSTFVRAQDKAEGEQVTGE